MTQRQAAEKLGVIKETVLNWENGNTKVGTIQLMALCNLYGGVNRQYSFTQKLY